MFCGRTGLRGRTSDSVAYRLGTLDARPPVSGLNLTRNRVAARSLESNGLFEWVEEELDS